jgi:hypothetical protein
MTNVEESYRHRLVASLTLPFLSSSYFVTHDDLLEFPENTSQEGLQT